MQGEDCLACRCKAAAVEHFDQTMQEVTWQGTGWEVDPVRQQLTQDLDEFEAQLRKGKVRRAGRKNGEAAHDSLEHAY